MRSSVIIPCLNEAEYIGRIEADLKRQTIEPEEVIVVDSGSSDGTSAIAAENAEDLVLRVFRAPDKGLSLARNLGATIASSDSLLYVDADMRLAPDFLERIEECAEGTKADVISPRFKPEGSHPVDSLYAISENIRIRYLTMGLLSKPAGLGGCFYIKKDVHHAVGGFDETKQEFEDWDFFKRLGRMGISFAYASEAVATLSSRRFVEQGRFRTLIQTIPDDTFVGRKIIRPNMKLFGIKPKF